MLYDVYVYYRDGRIPNDRFVTVEADSPDHARELVRQQLREEPGAATALEPILWKVGITGEP